MFLDGLTTSPTTPVVILATDGNNCALDHQIQPKQQIQKHTQTRQRCIVRNLAHRPSSSTMFLHEELISRSAENSTASVWAAGALGPAGDDDKRTDDNIDEERLLAEMNQEENTSKQVQQQPL